MSRKNTNYTMPDENSHWLAKFILREMDLQGLNIPAVAEQSGRSKLTIYQWIRPYGDNKKPRNPRLLDIEQVLDALGYQLVVVKKSNENVSSLTISNLIADRDRYRNMCKRLLERKKK